MLYVGDDSCKGTETVANLLAEEDSKMCILISKFGCVYEYTAK